MLLAREKESIWGILYQSDFLHWKNSLVKITLLSMTNTRPVILIINENPHFVLQNPLTEVWVPFCAMNFT